MSEDIPSRTEFVHRKQSESQHVHRLRAWEAGQAVWGYDIITGHGTSWGKTFSRNGVLDDDRKSLVPQIERRMTQALNRAAPPAAGFVWVATIATAWREGGTAHDDEPPMKFADLTDVVVKSVERIPE